MINPGGQMGSSISALTEEYHTIAHNLANINTTGYKRSVNSFSRELLKQMSGGQEYSLHSAEIDIKSARDFTAGTLLGTSRPLDVAISGKGFFVIETPKGPLYTRNGVFNINPSGQLVDVEGRIVAGADGPVIIPKDVGELQINIGKDGEISANGNRLGKLRIVDFGESEGELVSAGRNCFMAPEQVRPADAENASLRQGHRENSNVKRMEEVVSLISVSRLYEMNVSLMKRLRENAKKMIDVANS